MPQSPRLLPQSPRFAPQSPKLAPQPFTNPFSTGDSMEQDVPTTPSLRPSRSLSVASHPHPPFPHGASRDAFTPPASPAVGPVASRSQGLTLNTSVRPRTFDPAPSPSTINTRTSVMSNTSTSSSVMLGSLDSLVIAEDSAELDRPISNEALGSRLSSTRSTATNETDTIGVEDLLRESNVTSDRRKSRPASPRIPDCAIRDGSTYYKLKGYCRGATKFRKDGHWDSIQLTNEYEYGSGGATVGGGDMMRASDGITVPFQYETTKVGACGECGYAHDLEDVELDKSGNRKALPSLDSSRTDNISVSQPKPCAPLNLARDTASGSSSNPTSGKAAAPKPTMPACGASKRAPLPGRAMQPCSGPPMT